MKKYFKTVAFGMLGLAIFGFGYLMFTGHQTAQACGWGGSGGQGYVPERGRPGRVVLWLPSRL